MRNIPTSGWELSRRVQGLYGSPIREIAKQAATRPKMISFAGGMPSPQSFPVEMFRQAAERVLRDHGAQALQYGPTAGYAPLRDWIAQRIASEGAQVSPEQVQIVSGSQQGLDLLGKALLNQGDHILVETPTYVGALQALSLFEPQVTSIDGDDGGIAPSELRQQAERLRAQGERPAALYVIPTFQNPTGRTLSEGRREALVSACLEAGVPIIEDAPYSELDFAGRTHRSLYSLAPEHVVYLGSFSKILSPGLRLGYLIAPPALS